MILFVCLFVWFLNVLVNYIGYIADGPQDKSV